MKFYTLLKVKDPKNHTYLVFHSRINKRLLLFLNGNHTLISSQLYKSYWLARRTSCLLLFCFSTSYRLRAKPKPNIHLTIAFNTQYDNDKIFWILIEQLQAKLSLWHSRPKNTVLLNFMFRVENWASWRLLTFWFMRNWIFFFIAKRQDFQQKN